MATEVQYFTADEATSVVTLAQAKKQVRVTHDHEDELIGGYIDAAQEVVENELCGAVMQRSMVILTDKFPSSGVLTFMGGGNDQIEKVEYFAPDASELSELSNTAYRLRNSNTAFCFDLVFTGDAPQTAERSDAVKITITQGYTSSNAPKILKQAILLTVADFYNYREDRPESNTKVSRLLAPLRRR